MRQSPLRGSYVRVTMAATVRTDPRSAQDRGRVVTHLYRWLPPILPPSVSHGFPAQRKIAGGSLHICIGGSRRYYASILGADLVQQRLRVERVEAEAPRD